MKKIITAFVLLLFATVSIAVAADSLADVAKKEKERRAKLKSPPKTYTNKDIEDFIAKNGTSNGTIDSSDGSNSSATATDATATPEEGSADLTSEKNEQAWRQRFDDAQKKIDDAQKKYDEARANSAGDVYTNNGVDLLTGASGKRQGTTDQAKQDLENAQKALDDLQEQARQNGVPPGWVRH